MRLSGLLVLLMVMSGTGCRYSEDLPIEGRRFFMYGEMSPTTEQRIEAVVVTRGGSVAEHLNDGTAVAIRGGGPGAVAPISRTVSEDETITQWAIDETTSSHYQHLDQRAERLGIPVMTPEAFLNAATKEEIAWNKILTLGFGD